MRESISVYFPKDADPIEVWFRVRVRKTGRMIEEYEELRDARSAIEQMEKDDKKNGIYTENWYELVVVDAYGKILFCDLDLALELTDWLFDLDPYYGLLEEEALFMYLDDLSANPGFVAESIQEALDHTNEEWEDDDMPDWLVDVNKTGSALIARLAA